jgi:hypothetical protein
MSEKALHNLIIFVLLVAVVLLAMVASKSEHFRGAVPPSEGKTLSARLRSIQGTGALSARLRGMNVIAALPARLRGGVPITGEDAGAGGLKAQIKLPTLEHFRGVGSGQSMLSARLREASLETMNSASMASDKSGHDSTATKMSIVPDISKMTIMSNLTTK